MYGGIGVSSTSSIDGYEWFEAGTIRDLDKLLALNQQSGTFPVMTQTSLVFYIFQHSITISQTIMTIVM